MALIRPGPSTTHMKEEALFGMKFSIATLTQTRINSKSHMVHIMMHVIFVCKEPLTGAEHCRAIRAREDFIIVIAGKRGGSFARVQQALIHRP